MLFRSFTAKLTHLDGKKLEQFDLSTKALAERARDQVLAGTFSVASVERRRVRRNPPAPFTTSTLQQEAARKLRFTAQRTMGVAQQLYENGYITYMRTDSTNLSTQALDAARAQVRQLYGAEYLPDAPRQYTTRVRGAQEAHEAIRPAGDAFRTPESLRRELDGDALRVYELIWMRTVASQMRDATGMRTNVRLQADAGADGAAVGPLREHCRRLGYAAFDWGRGCNTGVTGDPDAWLQCLAAEVGTLLDAHAQPATLVGWSLGGIYARELARLLPGRVRQVITIEIGRAHV